MGVELNEISTKLSNKGLEDKNSVENFDGYESIMELLKDNEITENEISNLVKKYKLSSEQRELLNNNENQIRFLKKIAKNVFNIEIKNKSKQTILNIKESEMLWINIDKEILNDFNKTLSENSSQEDIKNIINKYNKISEKEWDSDIDDIDDLIEYFELKIWNQIVDLTEKKYPNCKITDKNISENDLNILLKSKTQNEILLILSNIKNDINSFKNLNEKFNKKNIGDIYLDILKEEWKYKEIESLLDSGILYNMWICASFEKVVEIREFILWVKSNKIKGILLKRYWDKASNEIFNKIDSEIKNPKNKDWKKYCSISFVKIIQDFDSENKWDKIALTKSEIKKLIDWVLSIEKSKSDVITAKTAEKLKKTESEIKDMSNEEISKKLNDIWESNEEILKVIDSRKSFSKIRKSRNFIDSLTDKEFDTILKNPEGKTSLQLKQDIEIERSKILMEKEPEERLFKTEGYEVVWWFKEEYQLTDNNSITTKNGVTIDWITKKEYKDIIGNEEALKNLIDMREKLNYLGLDFVWENRDTFVKVLKNNSDLKWSDFDITDWNLIDHRELNILLQFILKISWEKKPSTEASKNYAKILEINNIWEISDNKNTFSGLSNIWQKFVDIWYFNSSWWVNLNWEHNLRTFVSNDYKK